MSKIFVGSRISTCFPSRQRHQAMFSSLSTVFTTNCQKSSDAQRVNKYIYKREQIIFLVNIYNASNMEVFNSSLNLQCIWDKTAETVISAFSLEATHRIQRKSRESCRYSNGINSKNFGGRAWCLRGTSLLNLQSFCVPTRQQGLEDS